MTRPTPRMGDSGREKSNRKDKGTKRSNYVLKPKIADDTEIEHAPPHKTAPVSLPTLRFLQTKMVAGEEI
jgi:hypothetical protein